MHDERRAQRAADGAAGAVAGRGDRLFQRWRLAALAARIGAAGDVPAAAGRWAGGGRGYWRARTEGEVREGTDPGIGAGKLRREDAACRRGSDGVSTARERAGAVI